MNFITRINTVDVLADDWSEEYVFVIAGAVCARFAFDAIRMDSESPEFDDYRDNLFKSRASDAVTNHASGIGPIYI